MFPLKRIFCCCWRGGGGITRISLSIWTVSNVFYDYDVEIFFYQSNFPVFVYIFRSHILSRCSLETTTIRSFCIWPSTFGAEVDEVFDLVIFATGY